VDSERPQPPGGADLVPMNRPGEEETVRIGPPGEAGSRGAAGENVFRRAAASQLDRGQPRRAGAATWSAGAQGHVGGGPAYGGSTDGSDGWRPAAGLLWE